MIVYYSILAYTCAVAWFGCFIKQKTLSGTDRELLYKKQNSISLFFALLSVVMMVYFVGMRTDYIDTWSYIYSFNNLEIDFSFENFQRLNDSKSGSAGYYFLEMVFKKYISDDCNNWFLFLAIFQAGAVATFYYRYSVNYTFSIYLFITSTAVTQWMMNGIRQFTAVCLVLYFFNLVLDRKFIRFLVVIIIAYFIHSTAVFWIPIYFVVRFKPFSKQIWICVVATLLIIFFVDNFTDWLNTSLDGTKYEGEDITTFGVAEGVVDDGVNPIRVLVYAIPPGIALWRKKYIEERSNPLIDVCINMSTATVGIYMIGMVTSGILIGRIPAYFEYGNYILLPWLLKNAFDGKFKRIITLLCIVGYFAYFYFTMVIQGKGFYVSSILNIYQFA